MGRHDFELPRFRVQYSTVSLHVSVGRGVSTRREPCPGLIRLHEDSRESFVERRNALSLGPDTLHGNV